ncbi:GTP-sensing pleiotropic transcriptional regulator CodY [Alkalibacter rhizosphaerae]|uniref:Global transcriptional regulator CodY n=1 Tax=Alkalibacter rhizosphaerae TaxID=2815577 RepID=A0A975AI51_9FIRM|nr:GTP-sensing pleiotropic transcriptional regulator CodY [Alkalibacter rhizosphaerae]QSX08708.1 GTP-sensing pleiotropic transcriptional regulator CodY [Alkalibacter rhizosphaerae]
MLTLLEKIRKVNKVLQDPRGTERPFSNLSNTLNEVMSCNVYIASNDGDLLGYSFFKDFECELNIKTLQEQGTKFPEEFSKELGEIKETISNRIDDDPCCVYDHSEECLFKNRYSTFVPINGAGERLGTLVLARFGKEFTTQDLILGEVSATVVGMEMMRLKNLTLEREAREKNVVQMAIGTLSYSEMEAVNHIFRELDGDEGLLVASKIADRVGITRSVIVNALRKLESAGVIETRSLGMKGTFIRVLNPKLTDELEKNNEK